MSVCSDGVSSSDAILLATAGYDHTIKFWEPHTGVCKRTCQHQDSQVNALTFQPDRTLLAAAGYQHVRMYDVNSTDMSPIINFEGVSKNVVGVGFLRDGRCMFTASEDRSAKIWDVKTGGLHCQRVFQVDQPMTCIVLHPNQVELFIGDQAGTIHQWDLRSDQHDKLIPEPDAAFQHIDIDSSGRQMAAINSRGSCYIWSLSDGATDQAPVQITPKRRLEAHTRYGLKCRFSADGQLLCTTSADHTAKIWSTKDYSLVKTLEWRNKDETQRWVWDCAFSSDSKYLFTASSDEQARLWNLETGSVVRTYKGHTKALTCLAFSDHD
ncbi:target of rapamycin complex subunit lst8-like [Amphibalanus amphitrite]|nr:target of rapamycin complex subunit lst8-like [Amphibalanus amphitrite]XP_043246665.1 target of rapamycin complex subunit lst8-like [Amphibalanus amphitrite]XP_043246666.1 target of rapamycin complex subunit lst8-like [Amphibalanus amphitrite]XP_043246667.1 target of rapamycin complex subunit lst8-like [Amphibalanus amphitrite]XP_043246668.1 target of rapamycin complex subunit lst8-like [Amphibalanus amphitrite]